MTRLKELWKRFWSNPYKWGLWHWVGGRKWTHIMRDFAYQNPMLMFFIGLGLGIWLHAWLQPRDLIIGGSCLLLAHLFWGTKWKKGQGLNGYQKDDEDIEGLRR